MRGVSLASLLKKWLPGLDPVWFEPLLLTVQTVLIVLLAIILRALVQRLISRLERGRKLPLELVIASRRTSSFLIFGSAALLILDRYGVSSMVFWSAITGFATVAAVAFFAAWSVLSNIFCAALIYITRPFRLHDRIEILENGDKLGLGGEVLDINPIYTTLQESTGNGPPSRLKVPNSLFFQRVIRVRGAAV